VDGDGAGTLENGSSHSRTLQADVHWMRPKFGCITPQTRHHDHADTLTMPQTLEPATTEVVDEDVDAFFTTEDLWAVIVWNDDVTTFQTVIQAFVEILGHTVERADQLAWKIHRTGKAVAAVRPKDEAESAVHALHRRGISATLARA